MLREPKGGAFRTRFGRHRADLEHQPIDILMWAAPDVAIGVGVYLAGRALSARRAAA